MKKIVIKDGYSEDYKEYEYIAINPDKIVKVREYEYEGKDELTIYLVDNFEIHITDEDSIEAVKNQLDELNPDEINQY